MASAGSSVNAEAASQFWTYFQSQKQTILGESAKSHDISHLIRELNSKLREAFIYLPPYDQKQFTKDIDVLRALLHKKHTTLGNNNVGNGGGGGKSGFKFKSASAVSRSTIARPPAVIESERLVTPDRGNDTDSGGGGGGGSGEEGSFVFSGIDSKWIVASPCSNNSVQTDCELRDISNSIVDLRPISNTLRALNCHRITNTLIICHALAGSATIRDSHRCTVVLGVRQFRLENSELVHVLLHCASHPIIERSKGVQFAEFPSVLQSESMIHGMDVAGLCGLENMFDRVDDFNWLRRQASPNWRVHAEMADDGMWSLVDDESKPRERVLDGLLPQVESSAN